MRVGIAADHGGFGLKEDLAARLRAAGHEAVDFGAQRLEPGDAYPGFVVLLARAVAAGSRPQIIGMKTFGPSAPWKELQRKFGFEPEQAVAAAKEMLGRA